MNDLLIKMDRYGKPVSKSQLTRIVEENDKQRFGLNGDRSRIRANQEHSIAIDLGLPPQTPPSLLLQGAAARFLDSIRQQGLCPKSRQQVHVSDNKETEKIVGQRHGKPAILEVNSGKMARQGFGFFLSDTDVWLTETVPKDYISFPA
ncbi:MAG: RNA 2'-phosphotransferase [Cyanophyceae cyanobacterium]